MDFRTFKNFGKHIFIWLLRLFVERCARLLPAREICSSNNQIYFNSNTACYTACIKIKIKINLIKIKVIKLQHVT